MNIFFTNKWCYCLLVLFVMPSLAVAQLNASGDNASFGQFYPDVLSETKNGVKQPKAIKGDFVAIGNSVIQHRDPNVYMAGNGNNLDMRYINVAGNGWINSSGATLELLDNSSNVIQANDPCAKIVYAGLYWTGRDLPTVAGLDMRKVKVKGPKGNETEITAERYYVNPSAYNQNGSRREYVAYADVSEFVKAQGVGEYIVGNIKTLSSDRINAEAHALNNIPYTAVRTIDYNIQLYSRRTAPDTYYVRVGTGGLNFLGLTNYGANTLMSADEIQKLEAAGYYLKRNVSSDTNFFYHSLIVSAADGLGFFGGWKMVVVYESETLAPKSFSLFDGMETVTTNVSNSDNREITVKGFITPAQGNIDSKFSFLVTEGDFIRTTNSSDLSQMFFDGDNLTFKREDIGTNITYQRRNVMRNNTFDGTINIFSERNPDNNKNFGVDIEYDPNFLKNRGLLKNNQRQFSLNFRTTGDTYWLQNFTIAIDTYLPEPYSVGSYVGEATELSPGDEATFRVDIFNYGNEDIVNSAMYFPIPQAVDFELVTAVPTRGTVAIISDKYIPAGQGGQRVDTPNGYIKWDMSSFELPTTNKTRDQAQEPIASMVYKVRIAKDCNKLRVLCKDDPIKIKMEGFMRGSGKYSGLSLVSGSKLETNLKDDSIEVNPCKYSPTVKKNNVEVKNSGTVCQKGEVSHIQLCDGDQYDRVPDFNLSYVDEVGEKTLILYDWAIMEYEESQLSRTVERVVNDQGQEQWVTTKLEVRSGAVGKPVDLGFGTTGLWTTKTDGIRWNQKDYPYSEKGYLKEAAAVVRKLNYTKPGNIFLIQLKAQKLKYNDATKRWTDVCGVVTDYTEIRVTDVPKKTITFSPNPPVTGCVADQNIHIFSPDNKDLMLLNNQSHSVTLKVSYYWHEVDNAGKKITGGVRFPKNDTEFYEMELRGGAAGTLVARYPEVQEVEKKYKLYVHYISNGRCGVPTIDDVSGDDYSYGPIPVQGTPRFATVEPAEGGFWVTPVKGAGYTNEYRLQYLYIETKQTEIDVPKVQPNGRIQTVKEIVTQITSQEYRDFLVRGDNFIIDQLNESVGNQANEAFNSFPGVTNTTQSVTVKDKSTDKDATYDTNSGRWFVPVANKAGNYKIIVRSKLGTANCPSEVTKELKFDDPLPAFINPALIHWIKRD